MTMTLSNTDVVPTVDWDDFIAMFRGKNGWLRGEHVGMVGPTNSGKTTLAYSILPIRQYVTVLSTKPASASIDVFYKEQGYKLLREWPKATVRPAQMPRRLLWPEQKAPGDVYTQARVIHEALAAIYQQGGWCVYWDELKYLVKRLGLANVFDTYLLQGRELGISVVGGTQRPAWVPLELFDQSTHLFFWTERDDRNLSRISGISSLDTYLIRRTILDLERHEFLYINTRTADMLRSKVKV